MQSAGHILMVTLFVTAVDAVVHFVPPDITATGLTIGALGIGALLPDIDASESSIRHQWDLASSRSLSGKLLNAGMSAAGVKHRGLTHYMPTALAVIGLATLLGWWIHYPAAGLAFGLGYFSHLLADGLTKSGVPAWPYSGDIHLLPRRLRFRTGSIGEVIACVIAIGLLAGLLLISHNFILYLLGGLI
jgi:membrane-bound metal-dependent hydrolase YbcI (DUF457 family)